MRKDAGAGALRAIAVIEFAKGALAVLGGSGVLLLVGRDLEAMTERLVTHLHLDPASHYPQILLKVAAESTVGRLHLLAAGMLVYAAVRIAEAYGLWRDRAWAEWLAALTAGIYLPFEVVRFAEHRGPLSGVLIVLNLFVVVYLFARLDRGRRRSLAAAARDAADAMAPADAA